MDHDHTVDINLIVHNGAATVAASIDSVLAQTFPHWRMTLIDDGSTDDTPTILASYARQDPRIALKRLGVNGGAVKAFQHAFWLGDADFVMPKSADDLLAPNFLATVMDVIRADPRLAMVHAGGLSFRDGGFADFIYPSCHRLHAVGDDPVLRAAEIMRCYTSSPSFWGIYRRDAVDRLAPIAYRAGWDHVVLAELALYGDIRHVPEVLYWRRGRGRDVLTLARAATREYASKLELDGPLSDPLWRAPCVATAYAHVENFRVAPLPESMRVQLIAAAIDIFSARWLPFMRRELAELRGFITTATRMAAEADPAIARLAAGRLHELLTALAVMMPDADLAREYDALALLAQTTTLCPA